MRGLLINNYYAVRANAKVFSGFMLLLGLFAAAVISQSLLIGYIFLAVIGFSVNMSSSLRKEFISKWGKYKLTAPVRRADIVKSHFISQLIWLFVGMAFAGAVVGLVSLLNLYFGPEPAVWQVITSALILLLCSAAAFAVSYPLAVVIFREKEY